jgi:iron complex outermembrane receptor protein
VALVVASLATAAPARAQPCDGTIDVHVVDADTHEPVIAASVRLDGTYLGDTDDSGHFLAGGLCAVDHVIEAERIDYAVGRATASSGAAIELQVRALAVESIAIVDEAPPPADMRSTAVIAGAALERTRGRGFSETLTEVPGVAQLRAASGMAKPIVRGQFGRRLLLVVDGIRHRSQEWGLDHAPEIDPFIAGELAVVRGASGVRHGPDAIGGAVLVRPPALPTRPGTAAELHAIGTANGRGGSLAARVQGAPARWRGLAGQLEGSLRRTAAPSTPDYPLDNTGVAEWNLGATAGYRDDAGAYTLSYRHYQARLGVCGCLRVESSADFYAQLAMDRPTGAELYTADFEIERPYQEVGHDLALARGRWSLPALGAITATYGFQFDHRRELEIVREATTGPQFRFRLFTHDLDVAVDHRPLHLGDHLHLRGSIGALASVQTHRYAGLPLVPDFQSYAAGVYAIERLVAHETELEAGVRYDVLARSAALERTDFLRLVRSGQLAADACGGGDGDPVACASSFHTVSASLGALRRLGAAGSIKLDLSAAARPPSTDEQYLNGTSPTFPVLGLGKPDLGPETVYSASITAGHAGRRLTAEASAFANLIDDYIYFAPAIGDDGRPIFDVLVRGTFPRFVTRPVDATFYGADGGFAWAAAPWLELGGQLSVVRARNLTDRSYLVLVPPDRVRGSVTYRAPRLGGLRHGFASLSLDYTRRQDRFDLAADFAPPPPSYALLGAELGGEVAVAGQPVTVALQGANLTNARHRDYTSLLRYFADQPGWQLMLRLSTHVSTLDD